MKKNNLLIILCLIATMVLTSCNWLSVSQENESANEMASGVLAIEQQNNQQAKTETEIETNEKSQSHSYRINYLSATVLSDEDDINISSAEYYSAYKSNTQTDLIYIERNYGGLISPLIQMALN